MQSVIVRELIYGDYGRCIELSNKTVSLLVTVDLGPRIIRYGFVDKKNVLLEGVHLCVPACGGEWRLYGGHRLWSSPEEFPRTYYPDNTPVEWEKVENGIRVYYAAEPWVQVEKEMVITLSHSGTKVQILHRLINKNAWPVELAAWGITCMAPGGMEIVPVFRENVHFSEGSKGSRILVLWAYTDMSDPRVYWGNRYITLRHDKDIHEPIKFGIFNKHGWGAYLNEGYLFIKRYMQIPGAVYPDHGVSYETYASDEYLELECLSPLEKLKPECSVSLEEEWELFEGVEQVVHNDERGIDSLVDQLIRKR
jgi:hypothetical protein